MNPGTPLLAVLRVESHAAVLNPEQGKALISSGLKLLTLPGVQGLQIDFDAKDSERNFYGSVLRELRSRMPATVPLSMTALVSWCLEDRWLSAAGLEGQVDEAVPMLFRMGSEAGSVRARLSRREPFEEPLAQTSYGLSTDEPLPRLRGGRRCYVFCPGPWTAAAWDRISRALP